MPKGRRSPRTWLPSERFALTNWSRAPSKVLRRWLSGDLTCTDAPPHNFAGFVYNAHRRPLAPNVQPCKHGHHSPFVIHKSPAKA